MKGSRCSFAQRFRNQRRKIRPSTNPIPSAVNTAFVGFSRTYCSASSWNVRARLLASPHACSALPRASPQACSALPRYCSAKAPAADFKSSAALRACSLLLCNLSCAWAVPDDVCSLALFSSAIGNLQLGFLRLDYPRALLNGQTPTCLKAINAAHDCGGLPSVKRFSASRPNVLNEKKLKPTVREK